MKCGRCSYHESKVTDSRSTEDNTVIRRRRECLSCGFRFTTYEKLEEIPIIVLKKDRSRQPFDRNKILNGLMRACVNRPVTLEQIEAFIDEIEYDLFTEREVTTKQIGDMIITKLRTFDEVAYVRFVSVYKEFSGLESFMEELTNLKNTTA